MPAFFGIDTSNYTTSIAVARDGKIVENLKLPVSVGNGERGIRQSDAVFAHIKNLPELFEKLPCCEADAVGVSYAPRDAEGSYMPCFLSGISAAYAFAAGRNIPVYKFSHQVGHIAAAAYSAGRLDLIHDKFIAFHVSGGTTECLYVDGIDKIEKLGGTLDVSAGQLIDRTGVRLGFSFPCGPYMERAALDWINKNIAVKKPKVCVKGCDCNMSGLENQTLTMISQKSEAGEIAAYTIEFIKQTLEKMLLSAYEKCGSVPVLFAGGVMSCSIIKEYFENKYSAYFASPEFSSDNAAGTALLAMLKHNKEI